MTSATPSLIRPGSRPCRNLMGGRLELGTKTAGYVSYFFWNGDGSWIETELVVAL